VSFVDPVGSVLHSALDGLAMRQTVIADNIANVDTPGYRATTVDFETNLRRAIEDGSPADLADPGIDRVATSTPVGVNGNNVDLRKETMAAMQTSYQQQVVGRAISDRHSLVITAASTH
jgi:flagellar basal-body rod protein FlgB